MVVIDLVLALGISAVLSWLLLRYVHEHGPWRRPWAFGLVIFLCAWAGGAWIAPGLQSGWITYWVPFLVIGLAAAVLIVTVSPRHDLRSDEDTDQFEREEEAVLLSVMVLWWTLAATLVGLGIAAYFQ